MRDNNFTRQRGCLGPCAADSVAVKDNVNIDAVGDRPTAHAAAAEQLL
jgi:hypothetical protein